MRGLRDLNGVFFVTEDLVIKHAVIQRDSGSERVRGTQTRARSIVRCDIRLLNLVDGHALNLCEVSAEVRLHLEEEDLGGFACRVLEEGSVDVRDVGVEEACELCLELGLESAQRDDTVNFALVFLALFDDGGDSARPPKLINASFCYNGDRRFILWSQFWNKSELGDLVGRLCSQTGRAVNTRKERVAIHTSLVMSPEKVGMNNVRGGGVK